MPRLGRREVADAARARLLAARMRGRGRPMNEAERSGAQGAAQEGLQTDPLLLDSAAQRRYAQVTDDLPFGVPGRAQRRPGSVRAGFSVTVGVLLAVALGRALLVVASELLLVVVAAFIAIGLEPVVAWLVRHRVRRGLAVGLIAVGGLGLVAAFAAAAVPPLVSEATQLVSHAPDYLQALQDKHTTVGRVNASLHLEDRLRRLGASRLSLASFAGLLNVGRAVVSYTFQVLIVVVLSVYFLADFPNVKRAFYRLVPLPRRPRVGLLGDAILARTGGYLLGNVFTSLVAVVAQFLVLRALGVPFALVLSVFVGVFDLIPLVGSTVAGVVVTVVALATVSTSAAVVNLVFTVLYRLFEDYVLSPRILQRTVEVRPAVTVIAVLLGGSLLGIEGALIAVPVAAAVQLVVTEVVYPLSDSSGTS